MDTRHNPAQYQNRVRLCNLLTTIAVRAYKHDTYGE